jgi:hypothetical protein
VLVCSPYSQSSDSIVSQATEPDTIPNTGFLKLPGEIRNLIYSFLIPSNTEIMIHSPWKQCQLKKSPPTNSFTSLLAVNKLISYEASTYFYGANTFIIGNAFWGSRVEANAHGLKAFVSRVPAKHLAHIKKIELEIHERPQFVTIRTSASPVLGTAGDASALQILGRAIINHFTGLKTLLIQVKSGQVWSPWGEPPLLSKEEELKQYTKFLRTVLKHKCLEKVRAAVSEDREPIKKAAKMIASIPTPPRITIDFIKM